MLPTARRPTRDDARWFFGVPFQPQTYLNLLYLLLAFPLGLAYFIFAAVGLSLGVGLAVLVVGIPILLLVVLSALGIAAFELWLADRLLDSDHDDSQQAAGDPQSMSDRTNPSTDDETTEDSESSDGNEQPPGSPIWTPTADRSDSAKADRSWLPGATDRGPSREQSAPRKVLSVLLDTATWKAVAFLPLKFLFGMAAFVVMLVALSTGVSMLLTPLYYSDPGLYVGVVTDRPIELHPRLHVGWNRLLVTLEAVITIGFWRIERLWQALIVATAGGLLTLTTLHVLNGIASMAGRATYWLLQDATVPFRSA